MNDLTFDKDGNPTEGRSRRGWMLLAGGLGAALLLGACGKKHKDNDDDEEPPAP